PKTTSHSSASASAATGSSSGHGFQPGLHLLQLLHLIIDNWSDSDNLPNSFLDALFLRIQTVNKRICKTLPSVLPLGDISREQADDFVIVLFNDQFPGFRHQVFLLG